MTTLPVVVCTVLAVAIVLTLLALALVVAARAAVNDGGVPRTNTLAGAGDRVLVVTAHPDDEIAMAATMARASASGACVSLLCLTHGEASRSAVLDGVEGADRIGRRLLADARGRELAASAAALGAHDLEVEDYPDGGLPALLDAAIADVLAAIAAHDPTVLLTLDDVVGLYGHPDHVASAVAARTALARTTLERSGRASGGVRLYQATLPRRQVRLALRFSPIFRRSVDSAGNTPPEPTIAVRVGPAARAKWSAIDAHGTQRAVMADIQPLSQAIPRALYYRIFDREYFRLVPTPPG